MIQKIVLEAQLKANKFGIDEFLIKDIQQEINTYETASMNLRKSIEETSDLMEMVKSGIDNSVKYKKDKLKTFTKDLKEYKSLISDNNKDIAKLQKRLNKLTDTEYTRESFENDRVPKDAFLSQRLRYYINLLTSRNKDIEKTIKDLLGDKNVYSNMNESDIESSLKKTYEMLKTKKIQEEKQINRNTNVIVVLRENMALIENSFLSKKRK